MAGSTQVSGSTGPTAAATPDYQEPLAWGWQQVVKMPLRETGNLLGRWWQLTHWSRKARGSDIYAQTENEELTLRTVGGKPSSYMEEQKVLSQEKAVKS